MKKLTLKDLHNPNNIKAFLHKNNYIVEAGTQQGFQEYQKSLELWEMYQGRLTRVQRWLKKSVLFIYNN